MNNENLFLEVFNYLVLDSNPSFRVQRDKREELLNKIQEALTPKVNDLRKRNEKSLEEKG